jgi:tRNA pseudouridine38-40 synthase
LADSIFSTEPLPAGTRIACRIEYNGSRYSGWQSQSHEGVVTVQDELEAALAQIATTAIRVQCAGRTDTGVHAHTQVIHFDAPIARSPKAWVIGGNAHLPQDIRIHWAVAVDPEFHARFSAQARRYRYVIANVPIRSALLLGQVTWCRRELNVSQMHAGAQALVGEKDFSAFRAASCQSRTPMRNVQSISVKRYGALVVLDVKANAFLHHMVRNIAGALLAVGDGRKSAGWISVLLASGDRRLGAETASSNGLYLVDVDYPTEYGLPATPYGPEILGPEPQ